MNFLDAFTYMYTNFMNVEWRNPLRVYKREDIFGILAFTPGWLILPIVPVSSFMPLLVSLIVLQLALLVVVGYINNRANGHLPLWCLFWGTTIEFKYSNAKDLPEFNGILLLDMDAARHRLHLIYGKHCYIHFKCKNAGFGFIDSSTMVQITFMNHEEALITKLSV